MLLILLLIVCLLAFSGGLFGPADYRSGGIGLGGIVVLILVVLLLTGNL